MDRLQTLRLFITVAEKTSFAEAARTLRVSPAAATRAVASLEDQLGIALLNRTTRSVKLTPEGSDYLERARLALDTLDEAARAVRGSGAEPRGLLVVSAPVVFGRMHIARIVASLLRAHPSLNVRLDLTDRVVRLVDEGIDVAVRIADLSDSALRAVKIGDVRRVLIASPAYLKARGTPREIANLRDHDLITFDSFAPNGEWRFSGPRNLAIRFEPRFLTNSVETAIDAALDGLGIARALSYQVVRHLKEQRLVRLFPNHEPGPVPVHLVFQANRQHSPNVRALLDASRAYFSRQKID
jgi:DNA-binding transcriptional LysR family regulator